MSELMRDPIYLDFIRTRVCSFCPSLQVEPHHAIRHFLGIGSGGVGVKGSDYLSLPVCRNCHTRIHSSYVRPERIELLELIVRNLICFIAESRQ